MKHGVLVVFGARSKCTDRSCQLRNEGFITAPHEASVGHHFLERLLRDVRRQFSIAGVMRDLGFAFVGLLGLLRLPLQYFCILYLVNADGSGVRIISFRIMEKVPFRGYLCVYIFYFSECIVFTANSDAHLFCTSIFGAVSESAHVHWSGM